MTVQQEPTTAPVLRVVRGEPDDVELAALVAVLGALMTTASPPPPARSRWATPAPSRFDRTVLGSWLTSARPR